MSKYVIITPCFNEQDYISYPLDSVIKQTIKPIKWLIIDDGSTDRSAAIIEGYTEVHDWIKYRYRTKTKGQAYFTSNVVAIMEAWETVKELDFDYIAILDSDITLPEDYYISLFVEFEKDKKLGVASGIYDNLIDGVLCPELLDRRSTPKAIQVFRKKVFEQIGGYLPLKYGGEDTVSCVMARMYGWKAWSFSEIKAIHHRPTGLGNSSNQLKAKYTLGLNEYFIGSHWMFVLLKSLRRTIIEKPYIIGGLARIAGFFSGFFKQEKRQVPESVVKAFKKEQISRIFNFNRIVEEGGKCEKSR